MILQLIYVEIYQTRTQAQSNIFEYLEIFYNRKRKHSSLGNKTPYAYLKLKRFILFYSYIGHPTCVSRSRSHPAT
ncbi:MAG: hypothetical protein E4H13_05185 [Calditrichales bacterium]|nr:MAG: hypothetical protein E4H13_05185 [Calditrichales bacterium]